MTDVLLNLFAVFAKCLVLTIVLETAFFVAIGIRRARDFLVIALTQLTNPFVVAFSLWGYQHIDAPYYLWQIPLEAVVVVVEGFIYRKFLTSQKHPFQLSLGANYFSFSFGCILSFYGLF